ncbi:hypothetical protein [Natronorubrum sp. A-ect3]|uniref:hypothetical protein n=1 Tax=Natronorubrum sp. A-ect3 TaxID=3242698 RepID=UPI00359F08B4
MSIVNKSKHKISSVNSALFAYFLALLVPLGLMTSYLIGGRGMVITSFITIGLPILISAAFIHALGAKTKQLDLEGYMYSFNQSRIAKIYSIVLIFSILSLFNQPYRPWYFFIGVSICFTIIFVNSIFAKDPNYALILLKIALLSLVISYSVGLKYNFYFAGTSFFGHYEYASIIEESGYVAPMDIAGQYNQFPLYHIFISMVSILTSNGIVLSTATATPFALIGTMPLLYYISKEITRSNRIAIGSCLMYSTFPLYIYYSSYVITRTFAYMGFFILVYLIFRHKVLDTQSKIILSCVFILFILTTHSVSILQIMVVLFLLSAPYLLFSLNYNLKRHIGHIVLITIISAAVYWLYVSVDFTQFIMSAYLDPERYAADRYSGGSSTDSSESNLDHITRYIYVYTLVVTLFLGIDYSIDNYDNDLLFPLGFFIILITPLIIPSPIHVIDQLAWTLRFDRFMLLVSPFVFIFCSIGLFRIIEYRDDINYYHIVVVPVLFLIIFSAMTTPTYGSASDDSLDLEWTGPQKHFTEAEMNGLEYMEDHYSEEPIIESDSYVTRYFDRHVSIDNNRYYLPFETVVIDNPESSIEHTYRVSRIDAIHDSGVPVGSRGSQATYISSKQGYKKSSGYWTNESVSIYNNANIIVEKAS